MYHRAVIIRTYLDKVFVLVSCFTALLMSLVTIVFDQIITIIKVIITEAILASK